MTIQPYLPHLRQTLRALLPSASGRSRLQHSFGAFFCVLLLSACAPDIAPTVTGATPTAVNLDVTSQALPTVTPTPTVAINDDLAAQAQEFAHRSIVLVNEARAAEGLHPLVESPVLAEVAQGYSGRMAAEDFYGHEDPQGNDVSDRIVAAGYLAQMNAENIAAGQPDPETVVEGWLNSPGHRANIMNPDLREIGAGYATSTAPPYYHYWTHVFATPDASVGRDKERYAELVLAQLNELRRQAGAPALTLDATLVDVATTHLQTLVESHPDANDIEQSFNQVLAQASDAALPGFQQVFALSAAGPATPEDVVAMWVDNDSDGNLMDAALTAAGVAYIFVEEDEYRHYWLLLLGG